jgi:predicted RNase H-like HicB family nuclease
MQNDFTSLIEKHEQWYVGSSPEVPEANGQGKTLEECRQNLAEAIALVLLDKREDAFSLATPFSCSSIRRSSPSAATPNANLLTFMGPS